MQTLQVRGKRTFFAGTNIFYILLRQTAEDPLGYTDDAVVAYLNAQVPLICFLACPFHLANHIYFEMLDQVC